MDMNPKEKSGGEGIGGRSSDRTRWSARDVGKAWQLQFFRMCIRIGGRRAAYHMMYLVVFWYIVFSPEVRRRTRYYLDRRFPERRGRLRGYWDSYRLVCSFGQILIDQFSLALGGADIPEAVCTNEREMKAAAEKGSGAVLLVSHLGCWQIAMSALAFLDKPVSAVMMPQGEDAPVARMMSGRFPFSIIDPRNGMASVVEMMNALQEGRILTIMGDRVFGGPQSRVYTEFLGGKIALPLSPYRLAGAAGVPILVLHSARLDACRYEVTLARVIEVDKTAGRPLQDYEPFARQFAEEMEEFVKEYPWQFFNFFDLWEGRAGG